MTIFTSPVSPRPGGVDTFVDFRLGAGEDVPTVTNGDGRKDPQTVHDFKDTIGALDTFRLTSAGLRLQTDPGLGIGMLYGELDRNTWPLRVAANLGPLEGDDLTGDQFVAVTIGWGVPSVGSIIGAQVRATGGGDIVFTLGGTRSSAPFDLGTVSAKLADVGTSGQIEIAADGDGGIVLRWNGRTILSAETIEDIKPTHWIIQNQLGAGEDDAPDDAGIPVRWLAVAEPDAVIPATVGTASVPGQPGEPGEPGALTWAIDDRMVRSSPDEGEGGGWTGPGVLINGNAGVGTGGIGSLRTGSTDTVGVITVEGGSDSAPGGVIARYEPNTPWQRGAVVVLAPANEAAATAGAFLRICDYDDEISSDPTDAGAPLVPGSLEDVEFCRWELVCGTTPLVDGTVYRWSYVVLGAGNLPTP